MERASGALRWLALATSLLLPGAGHAISGRARRASIWICALLAISLLSTVAARWWLGALWVGAVLFGAAYVACSIDSYRVAEATVRSSTGAWIVFACAICGLSFVAPVILALVLRWGALEAFKVPSAGMCPTLLVGDQFFVDKTAYRFEAPAHGDIVIYRTFERGQAFDFVFRVVAIEGDQVEVESGRLVLNGKQVPTLAVAGGGCEGKQLFAEELGRPHRIALDPGAPAADFRGRVPQGSVFVMGDNRDAATDSRFSGPVPIAAVKGRLWRLWFRGSKPVWHKVE